METQNDEATRWVLALVNRGEGAIDPGMLSREELRAFTQWILDPEHYREFCFMVKLEQKLRRVMVGRRGD